MTELLRPVPLLRAWYLSGSQVVSEGDGCRSMGPSYVHIVSKEPTLTFPPSIEGGG